jgi:DNA-binding transcriptional MerR regulator
MTVLDTVIYGILFPVERTKQRETVPGDAGNGISLNELAKQSGVPERTIRYYISRGLIPGPVRGGRGAEYTQEHLAVIQNVRRLQSGGMTLAEIECQFAQHAGDRRVLIAPESWSMYRISPDVTVQVRDGLSPWRIKHLRSSIARLAAELAANDDLQQNGDD